MGMSTKESAADLFLLKLMQRLMAIWLVHSSSALAAQLKDPPVWEKSRLLRNSSIIWADL